MMPLPSEWIDRIFFRLHGRFGNNFLDKFKIGQLDENGIDIGLSNAKQVWAEELAGISADRIKNALQYNYDYAPSCDQFKAQCKTPTHAHNDYKALPKPVMSNEQRDAIHDKLTQFMSPKRDMKAWAKKIIANPKAYPEISYRYAKEALGEEIDG